MRVSSNRRARGGRANTGGNRSGSGSNRRSNGANRSYDSNGPDGKIRGTAMQVYDKYVSLGTDAQNSGDRIAAENYFQHAEHYFRILAANSVPVRDRQMSESTDHSSYDDNDTDEDVVQLSGDAQPNGNVALEDNDSDDEDDDAPIDLSKAEQPDVALPIDPEFAEARGAEADAEAEVKPKRKVSRTRTLRRRTSSRNVSDKEAEENATSE